METMEYCGVTVITDGLLYSDALRSFLGRSDESDPRTLAALIKAGVAFVPKSIFSDTKHPLSPAIGGIIGEAVKEKTVERINNEMRFAKLKRATLAEVMPNAAGEPGITERHIYNLINNPERMTVRQTESICSALGVTMDYLRGVVDSTDRTSDYGGSFDLLRLYELLDNTAKASLWDVAMSLLARHNPDGYELFSAMYAVPDFFNISPLVEESPSESRSASQAVQ